MCPEDLLGAKDSGMGSNTASSPSASIISAVQMFNTPPRISIVTTASLGSKVLVKQVQACLFKQVQACLFKQVQACLVKQVQACLVKQVQACLVKQVQACLAHHIMSAAILLTWLCTT
jgi:hypothetical protein